MPDPLTLALIFMATGGAISAYSQYQAGKAQKQALDRQAQLELQKTQFELAKHRRKTEKLRGKQIAKYAASGVKTDVGSPLIVMEEDAALAELDALAIQWEGQTAADTLRYQGRLAKRTGRVGAFSTLLQTGGQMALVSSWGGGGGKGTTYKSRGMNFPDYWQGSAGAAY